jgi:hypothetical protein
MIKSVGAALGLFAFAVTTVLGLVAGNPAEVILLRSIWAMVIFCMMGMATGWVASRVLDEHVIKKQEELYGGNASEPAQATKVISGADGAGNG